MRRVEGLELVEGVGRGAECVEGWEADGEVGDVATALVEELGRKMVRWRRMSKK